MPSPPSSVRLRSPPLHGVLKRDGNIGLDVAAPLGTGRIAAERAAGAPALTAAEQGFEKSLNPEPSNP